MTKQELVSEMIKKLRRCAYERRKEQVYGRHIKVSELCTTVANFLEGEFINQENGEEMA